MDTKTLVTGIVSFIAGALLVATMAVTVEGCTPGAHSQILFRLFGIS